MPSNLVCISADDLVCISRVGLTLFVKTSYQTRNERETERQRGRVGGGAKNTPYIFCRFHLSISVNSNLSIYLSIYLSILIFSSIYLSIYLSILICSSIYLSFSVYSYLFLFISINFRLFRFANLYLYIIISPYLSIYLSIYLSWHTYHHQPFPIFIDW